MSTVSATESTDTERFSALTEYFQSLSRVLVIALAIALIGLIYGAVNTDGFLEADNLLSIVRTAAFIGIFAVGLTFVTISGNFFLLSLEETAGLSAILFAYMLIAGWGLPLSLLGTLVAAGLLGAVQGAIVGRGGNPIIVTLGAAGIIFGFASWVSNNAVIIIERPHPAEWLGTGQFLDVPNVTWAFVIVAIVAELVLQFTAFGRSTYLIGASKDAARASGFSPFWKAVQVFAISSAAAALVGILFASQLSQAQVSLFSAGFGSSGSLTISAIAAVMVGGTAIFGGRGAVWRTTLGAIFIAMVERMMVLRGFESGPRILFVGLAVVLSVSLYAYVQKES